MDFESLLTLSLLLKRQHIERFGDLRHPATANIHVAVVALEEVALLRMASPLLAQACDRFLANIRCFMEPQRAMGSVWAKAQAGLAIKLTRLSSDPSPLVSLLQIKKQIVAETLVFLRQRNQMLSKMLREHPRATERGFCETDKWAFDLQKRLQRLSIDAAILASVVPQLRVFNPSMRKVSFDAVGPHVIGRADSSVDRKSLTTSVPCRLELLVIRGSRILRVVDSSIVNF
ncbi:Aste57867_7447 [Aphanomyces stellatus]|uniref:Aste57867_6455 protein n=1 Tax=Aphanomyces stellatus TaxID=120398 RepID=A0A485KFH3_9STRA|nr:hypothetical protein As57867_007421 [Aphanomyces stellatus]KAF0704970.1 hypothetical protein As57867_007162 [Aphanomyces stellatus]KAF0708084.1 hypothetical protein As57867_006439 [Aphanomyces stellatus]VFT83445.1 Aste57867_6455 [Aphanomyces stellatus]VFT84114.1 Aste57867_7187 [Aphanomyces stellatus]